MLDDGKAEKKDAGGQVVPVSVPSEVGAAALDAFEYSRDAGQLDFQALSPHCHDDGAGNDGSNMSEAGFAALREAALAATTPSFVALAGMEWSTNSLGNHVGVLGSAAIAKTEREQTCVSGGWQSFDLDLAQPGEHFSYVEVLEVEANRAAWTAPIWIERI